MTEILNHHRHEDGQITMPLIIAVCKGHEEVVDVLLMFGVDIEQKETVIYDNTTFHGATALWCASCWGYHNIVKILVDNGTNVNNPTDSGSTPLRPACFDGRFKIVQYLVEHGADVNTANNNKHTCLMNACYAGYYDVIQYLLEKGADPERRNIKGMTALHGSAFGGHLAISKLLVETGSTMTKGNEGMTPLMMAAVNDKIDVVDYLSSLPECSREEHVDALELLGTSFLFKINSYMLKSYHFFETAIYERYKDPDEIIPKRFNTTASIEAITGKEECKTLYELEEIREDELALCIEAVTIRERVLGTKSDDLPDALIYTGCLFADNGDFDKCIDLLLYASKLSQNIDDGVHVGCFPQIFAEMFYDGIKINFPSLLKCCQTADAELKLDKVRIRTNEKKFRKYYETDILSCIYMFGIMLMTYALPRKMKNISFIKQSTTSFSRYHNYRMGLHHCICVVAVLQTITILM